MTEVLELEEKWYGHIKNACEAAVALANEKQASVHFKFNGTDVAVQPGEDPEAVQERWNVDMLAAAEAERASPECKAAVEALEAEVKRENEAHYVVKGETEQELRDEAVPNIRTQAQLIEYVESLVSKNHDYGSCVYAMSMAAVAAFNYVAHKLGATGFQTSCADLDTLRRIQQPDPTFLPKASQKILGETRNLKGPFIIQKGEDALYPQYNLFAKLSEFLLDIQPWLKEEAAKHLAEVAAERPVPRFIHPKVKEHWERLAGVESVEDILKDEEVLPGEPLSKLRMKRMALTKKTKKSAVKKKGGKGK